MAGLSQQVLVVRNHHVAVVRQVTVQFQHLGAVLDGAVEGATAGGEKSWVSRNVYLPSVQHL